MQFFSQRGNGYTVFFCHFLEILIFKGKPCRIVSVYFHPYPAIGTRYALDHPWQDEPRGLCGPDPKRGRLFEQYVR